jgi:hypothetical protein
MGIGIVLALAIVAADAAPAPSPALAAPRAFSVTPGIGATPLTSWPKGGAPRLVWTGFQVIDGGSRVFVQVTRDVDVDVQPTGDGLAVTLRKCRIHMRNNRRRLDTRFFPTPVKAVTVRQRRGGVELHIALREPVAARQHKQEGPAGSQFWMLDFGPAQAAGATPPSPKVAPPS